MNEITQARLLGGKAYVFAWIGALLGPVTLAVALNHRGWTHLAIAFAALAVAAMSINEGLAARKRGEPREFRLAAVVPFALLAISTVVAMLLDLG